MNSSKRKAIFECYEKGLLDSNARDRALALVSDPLEWWRGVFLLLRVLGTSLVLAGIVFFFAYNWQGLHRFLKFGFIESGVALCCLGAWYFGLNRLNGKWLLFVASVLTGVLLAVIGQTYQTGADAYHLFSLWLVLISPWVFMARFVGLWVGWLVLAHVAAISFWFQSSFSTSWNWPYLCWFLALGNACFLTLVEQKRPDYLLPLRNALWVTLLIELLIPSESFIFDEYERSSASSLCLITLIGALAGGFYYFRRISPDFSQLSIAFMIAVTFINSIATKFFFEGFEDVFAFLFSGILWAISASGTAATLMQLRKTMNPETKLES